ncbi:MAG: phosphatase PAP2 family protein [Flavobacteriales bacterium]|nr:MAG: phosphatase PAP2 family protein [Flavobacteriales bacterium]
MNEFITKDQKLFLFLNHLGSEKFDAFWILVSDKWIWIPFYAILLLILARGFKLKSFLFILLFIALGITISDQLAGIFKHSIARLRPVHEPILDGLVREVKGGGQYSFYSAHASNSFFIATYLSILLKPKYDWFPYFLFIWAGFVSYSRIYLGVHYPLDILYGGLVGFLLGGLFANLTKKAIG